MSDSTIDQNVTMAVECPEALEANSELEHDTLSQAIRLLECIEVECPTEEESKAHIHRPPQRDKNKGPEYIPRPPNKFFLYSIFFNDHVRDLRERKPIVQELKQPTVQKVISEKWNSLPSSIKNEWGQAFEWCCDEHRKKYPNYSYQPMRRSNSSEDGSSSSKKKTKKQTKKQTKKRPASEKKAKVAAVVKVAKPSTAAPRTRVASAPITQSGVTDTVAAASTTSFIFPAYPLPAHDPLPMLPVPLVSVPLTAVPALELQFSPQEYVQLQDASFAGPYRTAYYQSHRHHPYDGARKTARLSFSEVNSLPITPSIDEGSADVQASWSPSVDVLEFNLDTGSYQIRFDPPDVKHLW